MSDTNQLLDEKKNEEAEIFARMGLSEVNQEEFVRLRTSVAHEEPAVRQEYRYLRQRGIRIFKKGI